MVSIILEETEIKFCFSYQDVRLLTEDEVSQARVTISFFEPRAKYQVTFRVFNFSKIEGHPSFLELQQMSTVLGTV